jgi:hypothetical protein
LQYASAAVGVLQIDIGKQKYCEGHVPAIESLGDRSPKAMAPLPMTVKAASCIFLLRSSTFIRLNSRADNYLVKQSGTVLYSDHLRPLFTIHDFMFQSPQL